MEDVVMDDDWVDVNPKKQPMTTQINRDSEPWIFETAYKGSDSNRHQNIQDWRLNPIPQKDLSRLYESIRKTANALLATRQPIFKTFTNNSSIGDLFVGQLPNIHQQEMRCTCCLKFLRRFGDLAIVDVRTGDLIPLFWNNADFGNNSIFRGPVSEISRVLRAEKANRVLKVSSSHRSIGSAMLGGYQHMHFEFPWEYVAKDAIPGFSPAATSELASMLDRVLQDYDYKTVDHVAFLILRDKLPYASTHKASIRWLRDLVEGKKIEPSRNATQRYNLLYHYASAAFVGCISQLRSGTLSTLLDNVKAGKSSSEIKCSWEALANPLAYMRPQAAPSHGQVAAAEKLFEELGLTEQDMRRKYLTPAELPDYAYLYRRFKSQAVASATARIFGDIACKDRTGQKRKKNFGIHDDVSPTAISFAKLVNEILPEAKKVEYRLPRDAFVYFFITGLPGTKPLMQFHDAENLASWYTDERASVFPAKGLWGGWTQVEGIIAFPHLWPDLKEGHKNSSVPVSEAEIEAYQHKRHGIRYLVQFVEAIENNQAELCLFPSLLKGEFHGVRQTIEAYSISERTEYAIDSNSSWSFVGGVQIDEAQLSHGGRREPHLFRVADCKGKVETYEIVMFS